MKKKKINNEIIEKLAESGNNHICCVIEGQMMSVSLKCTEGELYAFLVTMCQNVPWALDVIENFVDDVYDEDIPTDESSYLN